METKTHSQVNFDRPPVVESVLGVQFDPLPELRNAHLALFWHSLDEEQWRTTIDAPPIQTTFERFGDEHKWTQAKGLRITPAGTNIRLQITNQVDDRMIQVQNSRFHYNWRRRGSAEYPRYAAVRAEFDDVFEQFQAFLQRKGLEIRLNQWELSYVNHIQQGPLWAIPADWHKVLPGLLSSTSARPRLESFGGAWHYEIEPRRGRLHISLHLGKSTEEPESEVLRLDLTARGPINQEAGLDLDTGLNLGHDMIVSTFVAITSGNAHRHWGRRK